MVLANSPVRPTDQSEGTSMMVQAEVHALQSGAISKKMEVRGCEVDENENLLVEEDVPFKMVHKMAQERSSSGKPVVHLTLKTLNMMEEVIGLQGLLIHLSNLQVRADFVNGKFGPDIDPQMLSSLDELRWSLFPQWHAGALEEKHSTMSNASILMNALLTDSQELFQPKNGNTQGLQSFAQWHKFLKILSRSDYWDATPPKQRCTHIFDNVTSEKLVPPRVKEEKSSEGERRCHRSSQEKRRKVGRVEEIILSSDSSDESSPSLNSSSYSSSEEELVRPRNRRSTDRREVVTPPQFQMDGKLHLRDYLDTYENYFKSKFKGNTHDKCQQLEQFLTGELLNVYHVCGGRKIRYGRMKEKLLNYYKKQKIGGRSYWKKEFEAASPKTSESLYLFGMRLTELAERAFSKSPHESAKKLREQFLSQIPVKVAEKIVDMERTLKVTSGGDKKRLNFSDIMQLANDLQPEVTQSHTIMWSDRIETPPSPASRPRQFWSNNRPGLRDPRFVNEKPGMRSGNTVSSKGLTPYTDKNSHEFDWPPQRSSFRRPSQRSPPRPSQRSSPQRNFPIQQQQSPKRPWKTDNSQRNRRWGKFCSHCGKGNHSENSCWRANQSCLICGGDHLMKVCPKYDPCFTQNGRKHLNE